MLPYILRDVTWEIFGVMVVIPSQILKRIDEKAEIDTWELDAATNIKAGNLTLWLQTVTGTISLNWLQISSLHLLR